MKSVDKILGIFEDDFTDFGEAVILKNIFEIVQENTLKSSKKIFFSAQKTSLNQNIRPDHACIQQDVLFHFYTERGQSVKKLSSCPPLERFSCLPPLFSRLPLWKTVRLPGKKLQNATNN